MSQDFEISEAEKQELEKYLDTYALPGGQESSNVHSFLNKIATSTDTTKLGNLTEDEIGSPRHPIRTYKELALFCSDVAKMPKLSEYLNKKSEIITSTSLSKDALLIKLAVVNKREIADVTPRQFSDKQKKNWFRKGSKQKIEY